MNRALLLEHALRDGEWHTRRDIQREVGYFLTNNAASELRSKYGREVEHRVIDGEHAYRLVEPAGEPHGVPSPDADSATTVAGIPLPASPAEQLRLEAA